MEKFHYEQPLSSSLMSGRSWDRSLSTSSSASFVLNAGVWGRGQKGKIQRVGVRVCASPCLFVCVPLSIPGHCSRHKATLLLNDTPTELFCCHGSALGTGVTAVNVHTGTSPHSLARRPGFCLSGSSEQLTGLVGNPVQMLWRYHCCLCCCCFEPVNPYLGHITTQPEWVTCILPKPLIFSSTVYRWQFTVCFLCAKN